VAGKMDQQREKGVTPIANSIPDFETDLDRYVLQKMPNGFVKIAIVVFTKLAVENFSWQFAGRSNLKNRTIVRKKRITN
jgi:hypothetical protein